MKLSFYERLVQEKPLKDFLKIAENIDASHIPEKCKKYLDDSLFLSSPELITEISRAIINNHALRIFLEESNGARKIFEKASSLKHCGKGYLKIFNEGSKEVTYHCQDCQETFAAHFGK